MKEGGDRHIIQIGGVIKMTAISNASFSHSIDTFIQNADVEKITDPTSVSNYNKDHLRYELAPSNIRNSELAKLAQGYSSGKWVVGYENRKWDERISAINEQLTNGNLDRKEVGWARQEIERKLKPGQYLAKQVKGNAELRDQVLDVLEKMASYEVGIPTEQMDKEWMQNYLALNDPAKTRSERLAANNRIYASLTATDPEFEKYKKENEPTVVDKVGRGIILASVALPIALGGNPGLLNFGADHVTVANNYDNNGGNSDHNCTSLFAKVSNFFVGTALADDAQASQVISKSAQIDSLLKKYNSGEYSKLGLGRILHNAENIAKKSGDKSLQEKVNLIMNEFNNGRYPEPIVYTQEGKKQTKVSTTNHSYKRLDKKTLGAKVAETETQTGQVKKEKKLSWNRVPVVGPIIHILTPDEREYTAEQREQHEVKTFFNEALDDKRPEIPLDYAPRIPFRLVIGLLKKIPDRVGRIINYPFKVADKTIATAADYLLPGKEAVEAARHPIRDPVKTLNVGFAHYGLLGLIKAASNGGGSTVRSIIMGGDEKKSGSGGT